MSMLLFTIQRLNLADTNTNTNANSNTARGLVMIRMNAVIHYSEVNLGQHCPSASPTVSVNSAVFLRRVFHQLGFLAFLHLGLLESRSASKYLKVH